MEIDPCEKRSALWQHVYSTLALAAEPLHVKDVRAAVGCIVQHRSAVHNILSRMVEKGIAIRTSLGCYQLAPPVPSPRRARVRKTHDDDERRLARWNRIIAAEVGP